MKGVELYGQVRHAVRIEGLSRREAARWFGLDPRTIAKILAFSVPPGYRRSRLPARPKLDPFVGVIDRILEDDKGRPVKQRHTFIPLRSDTTRTSLSYGPQSDALMLGTSVHLGNVESDGPSIWGMSAHGSRLEGSPAHELAYPPGQQHAADQWNQAST